MTQDRNASVGEAETPPHSMVDRLVSRAFRHMEEMALRHGMYVIPRDDTHLMLNAVVRALLDELHVNPTPGMIQAAAEPLQGAHPDAGDRLPMAEAVFTHAIRAALDGR